MSRKRYKISAGFTIIELLVAMTIGSVLMVAVLGALFHSLQFGDAMVGKTIMNAEARSIFDVYSMGGVQRECVNDQNAPVSCPTPAVVDNSGLTDDHDYLFGIRGRSRSLGAGGDSGFAVISDSDSDAATVGALMAVDSNNARLYRATLPPSGQVRAGPTGSQPPDYSLLSSDLTGVTVTCTDTDQASGGNVTAIGYPLQGCSAVGAQLTVSGHLRADPFFDEDNDVGTVLIDLLYPVGTLQNNVTDLDVRSRYWGAFTLNVD